MINNNYTIIDVETTGGSPLFHRVIEIGILRIERGEVVAEFKSLVNPGREIPEFITEFTGISEKMVNKAPAFEDLAEDILPLFEDSIFVAHNSSFDYKFIKTEFERAGYQFTMDTLCTVRLSRVLYPKYKKHNLSAIIDRFDFKCKHRHRAFDDAKVLWDFLKIVEKEFPAEHVTAALRRTIKKVPPKRQLKMPKTLESETVYEEYSF
jgi:DNA polymerase III subunit epsilon